jgi:tRNA pseudouridine38-40 synthase
MATYQSIVAYDGTDFAGFQRQKRRRTVQAVLETALRRLGWNDRSLRAAGRTDTGAHASGQVVAFELAWRRSPDRLTTALNAHLPSDVAVRRTEAAPAGFHPRYAARKRGYRYAVMASPQRDPLRERYAWRVWPAPDTTRLAAASALLLGRHDFRAFGPAPRTGGGTIRTVFRSEWAHEADGWSYRIEADAFLYRMVRRIVAALMSVGWGEVEPAEIAGLIETPSRRWQGRLAPAHGLCLEAVWFEGSQSSPPENSGG